MFDGCIVGVNFVENNFDDMIVGYGGFFNEVGVV